MYVNVTCSTCGVALSRKPSHVAKNRSGAYYCSLPCRTTRQTLSCATCGTPIIRHAYRVTEMMYCSDRCRHGTGQFVSSIMDGEPVSLIPIRDANDQIIAHAIIDADKAEWASRWRWHLNPGGYASRTQKTHGRRTHVALHRALLGLVSGDGLEGDHINRNRLDNRISNLRAIPQAGNRQNVTAGRGSSAYRGVSFIKNTGRWAAYIHSGRKRQNLGSFASEEEAARVAKEARLRLMPYAVD